MRAVVLVSGGAAITPFTTPEHAAGVGMAAGNTMTALRSHFLDSGRIVYSAPAQVGKGVADVDAGWQGFSEVPIVLPEALTVNAVGDIDQAGAALSSFLEWLMAEHGVGEIDLVVHSMGGLFSRAAIGHAHRDGKPLPVRRLVTLGTPWTGALLGDHHAGDTPLSAANGDPITETIMRESDAFASSTSQGAAEEVTARYLGGENGWNARQGDALAGIPVTLIGGSYFNAFDQPRTVWPHDGLVQLDSALARNVPPEVLPDRREYEFPDVHSIFVADQIGIDWTRALTWNPKVFEVIDDALI